MTLRELCDKYGYAESTVKNKWTTIQLKIFKDYGVKIVKTGRGSNVVYQEESDRYPHAVTMFHESSPRDIFVTTDLSLINWEFHIFLAIVTTPMGVFRGTISQLLQYMTIPDTIENCRRAQDGIDNLINHGFVGYMLDTTTDENYVTLAIVREKEVKMSISYQMMLTCKELADLEGKRSWIPLLKTWIGVQMLSDKEFYTIGDLQELTGLSAYQLREANKILNKNAIYRSSRAFHKFNRCIGQKVDLNGFYNEDIMELPEGFIASADTVIKYNQFEEKMVENQ